MENVFILTAVAGVVQLLKLLQAKDLWGALTIVAAAVVGALAAFAGFADVTIGEGIVLGLGASGAVTIARNVNATVTGKK